MSTVNVVIGIGYNGSHDPYEYQVGVRGIIAAHGTVDARIVGTSHDETWGTERAQWIAASFPTANAYNLARHSILRLAAAHGQEAVAFTVGRVDIAAALRAAAS